MLHQSYHLLFMQYTMIKYILEMWTESLVQLDKLFHEATWNSFENFSSTFLFYTFKAGIGSR